jgi:hypothetical protein
MPHVCVWLSPHSSSDFVQFVFSDFDKTMCEFGVSIKFSIITADKMMCVRGLYVCAHQWALSMCGS